MTIRQIKLGFCELFPFFMDPSWHSQIMRKVVFASLVLFCLPLVAEAQQGKLYRWVDENGQVHFSDSVPPQYSEQPKQRVDEHGIARENIAGKKTPEQIAAEKREAKLAQQRELQKRADRALLVTYQTVEEIQMHRDRRLELFQASVRVTELYLTNQRRQLDSMHRERLQYKPYSSDPGAPTVPPKLIREIQEAEALIDRHQDNLQHYKEEDERIRQQFEGDIIRFKKLKGIKGDNLSTMTAAQSAAQTVPE